MAENCYVIRRQRARDHGGTRTTDLLTKTWNFKWKLTEVGEVSSLSMLCITPLPVAGVLCLLLHLDIGT